MNNTRNEIKAQIIRAGFTMQEVCDRLHDDYGWSDSVSNLSNKLQRDSIRFREVVELADVLGYDIKWVPKETIPNTPFCALPNTRGRRSATSRPTMSA